MPERPSSKNDGSDVAGIEEEPPCFDDELFGVGAKMLRSMMMQQNVSSLERMISLARELGVRA